MASSKYLNEDPNFSPITLTGLPLFYVLNPNDVNEREIRGLSVIPDQKEPTILKALGAKKAHFRIHRLVAGTEAGREGIPFLLAHREDTGKPCSFSFVRVRDDLLESPARLQEVLYDLPEGKNDACIDDLLDGSQGPKGYPAEIPSVGNGYVVPVEGFAFSEGEDGSNRTFDTATLTRICFDDWYVTTSFTTHFHEKASRVFGFRLQYWIHRAQGSSLSALQKTRPVGDFYCGYDNVGKFKEFGGAGEFDLSNGNVDEKLRVVSGGLVVGSKGSLPLEDVLDEFLRTVRNPTNKSTLPAISQLGYASSIV